MAHDPHPIEKLIAIMAQLRAPEGGCPWDTEQNFATIAPYTIEEAYEVADAIQQGDMTSLKDELGDLLFQVAFHARMAEEENSFAFNDVVDAICDKMVRRHPHVFGDEAFRTEAEQTVAWEKQKAAERENAGDERTTSALDGVALALPALMRAEKLQKRAARVGFDWPETGPVFDKITEEMDEIREVMAEGSDPEKLTDEVGDLLFACVNLARHLKIDPEVALRQGNEKFSRRFKQVESSLREAGKSPQDCAINELEEEWDAAKAIEREDESQQ